MRVQLHSCRIKCICDGLVLERGQSAHWHSHRRLVGRSLGGSGCRYASSVASGLAQGLELRDAAAQAGALKDAAANGTPFCAKCEKARQEQEQQAQQANSGGTA